MSPAARRRVDGAPWVALLATILRGVPRFEDAACVRRPELFDFDGRGGEYATPAAAEAIDVCRHQCPALEDCRRWVASLAKVDRPPGVVAGVWVNRLRAVRELDEDR